MKVNNFISDWNRTHTSSPSFQNAIEWARKETIKEAASWFGDYLTELRDSVNWFYGSSKMKSGRDRFMEAMKK